MAEAAVQLEDIPDELLEKITALSKGFLLVINESDEKICSERSSNNT
jgi:hypothetical protein